VGDDRASGSGRLPDIEVLEQRLPVGGQAEDALADRGVDVRLEKAERHRVAAVRERDVVAKIADAIELAQERIVRAAVVVV
jgi:hypothetical protein